MVSRNSTRVSSICCINCLTIILLHFVRLTTNKWQTMLFWLLCVLVLIGWYVWSQRKPKGFPPGPWGIPILGAFPMLGMEPHKGLIKLKAKYGPIVGYDSIGGMRAVSISDYKLLKEAANNPIFSGRPHFNFALDRSGGVPEGIVFTEGQKWQEQRRFTLRKLRDFGFGTRSMEAIVHEEIEELIERLKRDAGRPISTLDKFNGAVLNALWTILVGERLGQEDPKLMEIFGIIRQDLGNFDPRVMLSLLVPWIPKHLPDWMSGYSKILGPGEKLYAIVQPYIDSHFATHIPGQPRDFIDAYIDEIKSTDDPNSSFHASKAATKSLPFTLFDLFMAGQETTSTTLSWILLYMARNRHVQDLLQAEIERVVGNSRLPSLADRVEMPYTEAVINEVLRARPLLPAPMQCAMDDTEFNGFQIPKGTIISLNLYDANYDAALWGDPENFRPERFLSKDGRKFVHQEGFVSFSTGKRACLGERLARDELFLFTTALFQVFDVDWDRTGEPPTLDSTPMLMMFPKPHKLVLTIKA